MLLFFCIILKTFKMEKKIKKRRRKANGSPLNIMFSSNRCIFTSLSFLVSLLQEEFFSMCTMKIENSCCGYLSAQYLNTAVANF